MSLFAFRNRKAAVVGAEGARGAVGGQEGGEAGRAWGGADHEGLWGLEEELLSPVRWAQWRTPRTGTDLI